MPAEITPAAVLNLILDQQIVEPCETLDEHADLFAAGLDSMAMMQLLLHVEDTFGIEVQPGEMKRQIFASPATLAAFLSAKRLAQTA